MQKTKLGVSVGLLGAAVYLAGLFSGYLAVILLAGYVLLVEDNLWLRRAAVKAAAILMIFSFATAVIGLIPDAIDLINGLLQIFGSHFSIAVVSNIVSFIKSILSVIQKVLLLALGVKALNQGDVAVPVVDDLINKYMG